jgi:hypothetical protein
MASGENFLPCGKAIDETLIYAVENPNQGYWGHC